MKLTKLAWAATIAAAMVAGIARGADSSKSLELQPGPGAGAISSSSLARDQAAKTTTISAQDIAAGDVVVPCAVWLVEGTADTETIRFEFTVHSKNGDVRFVRFAAVEPGAEYFSQPLSYSLADGTSFSSTTLAGFAGTGEREQDEWRFRPSGTTSISCAESNPALGVDNAWCSLAWIAPAGGAGYRWSGARSDSYPLCLVLVTFDKGTPAGTYTIDFLERQDSGGQSCLVEANGQKYDTKIGGLNLRSMVIVVEGASAPATPVATVVTSAVSRATFRLDTREGPFVISNGTGTIVCSTLLDTRAGPFVTNGAPTIAYSTEWHTNDTVAIYRNGVALGDAEDLVGEGD